jgi:hypothetical protein
MTVIPIDYSQAAGHNNLAQDLRTQVQGHNSYITAVWRLEGTHSNVAYSLCQE